MLLMTIIMINTTSVPMNDPPRVLFFLTGVESAWYSPAIAFVIALTEANTPPS
jgi:hypothetical protein